MITKEPVRDYEARRSQRLTSHRLADFIRSPHDFRNPKPPSKEDEKRALTRSAYNRQGSAAHCLILEGAEVYHDRFEHGGPVNPKTQRGYGLGTKKFTEWAVAREAELGGSKTCINVETFELVVWMNAAVRKCGEAAELLYGATPEVSALADYGGVPVQSRLDAWIPQRRILELKTVEDMGRMAMQVEQYGYRRQMAFYRKVVRIITGDVLPVHLIAVEKKEPFRVEVREFTDQELNDAERENDAAIRALNRCIAKDDWPESFDLQREMWT